MSILGEMFGYDQQGNDLVGINLDPQYNCAFCGISCSAHTLAMEAECLARLFGRREATEETGK